MKLEPIIQLPNVMTGQVAAASAFMPSRAPSPSTTWLASRRPETCWHKKNPGKLVELVIIFASDARMNGEERTRLAALMKRWEASAPHRATVVLASGLPGAMHRSILTGCT